MNFQINAPAIVSGMYQFFSQATSAGQLQISTAKPFYVAGELIQGTIQAHIAQPINGRAVLVRVVGYEKCEWNDQRTTREQIPGTGTDPQSNPAQYREKHHIKRHRGKKTFFDTTIPVFNLNDGWLQPGTYTWPFQYQLPEGVPGSFFERRELGHIHPDTIYEDDLTYGETFYDSDDELHGESKQSNWNGQKSYVRPSMMAVVQYKVKAILDIANNSFMPDLFAKQPIVVNPRLAQDLKPAFSECSRDVIVCCCCNKGRATIKCSFDKNAYVPGETCQIHADVDNQSEKSLEMHVNLYRTLTLKSGTGYGQTHVERVSVAGQKYEPVPEKSQKNQAMPLPLTGPAIKPSTNGSFVSCTYDYGVKAEVSWGTDIDINLPVTIYAPQPPQWGQQPVWQV
jgi:hypothetical protein